MSARAAFRLRPARADDQDRIRRLIRAVGINPMDLHWRHFVVAVDDTDRMIGCGQIKDHGDGSRELASLAVVEDWRGRGVARAVIERLMSGVQPPLWLTCRSGLVDFYSRFGFRPPALEEPLPRYFRRLLKVAKALRFMSESGQGLAILVWQGTCTQGR